MRVKFLDQILEKPTEIPKRVTVSRLCGLDLILCKTRRVSIYTKICSDKITVLRKIRSEEQLKNVNRCLL